VEPLFDRPSRPVFVWIVVKSAKNVLAVIFVQCETVCVRVAITVRRTSIIDPVRTARYAAALVAGRSTPAVACCNGHPDWSDADGRSLPREQRVFSDSGIRPHRNTRAGSESVRGPACPAHTSQRLVSVRGEADTPNRRHQTRPSRRHSFATRPCRRAMPLGRSPPVSVFAAGGPLCSGTW
jgi:hypothetical protein